MTEMEAEAYVARLARIWRTKDGRYRLSEQGFFAYTGARSATAELQIEADEFQQIYRYRGRTFCLAIDSSQKPCVLYIHPENSEEANQWLPLFRRNAWLSGLPLEATAHKKTEWMQGFSREEIEAWNLKI